MIGFNEIVVILDNFLARMSTILLLLCIDFVEPLTVVVLEFFSLVPAV